MSDKESKFILKSKTVLGGIIALTPYIMSLANEPVLAAYAPQIAAIGGVLSIIGRLFAKKDITFKPSKEVN